MFLSLVDMLRTRAAEKGSDTSFWYLLDGEDDVLDITFASLDRDSRAVAARLSEVGRPGDRVVILMAPGPDFLSAFFGCLYAGMIAVPAFLPDMVNIKRSVPRLQAIAKDAEAVSILTDELFVAFRDELWDVAPDLARTPWIIVGEATSGGGGDDWVDPGTNQETTAFIQYTSGSTSLPKGVVLSHGNLLANLDLIRGSSGGDDHFIGVSWLPPYHDMGLIGGILEPIYRGGQGALMSPLDFLTRPSRWVRAISTYRATTSPAPNFAFELSVRRTTPEEREGLDLSSWKYAFNGAEPVRASTLRRFAETFEPYGYSPRTMLPCYGLAESTLYVSAKPTGELPFIARFDREELAAGRAVPSSADTSVELVSCGVGGPLHDIRIVDPDSADELPEGRLGEIWLAGPSVGHGYWGRRRQTAEVFHAMTTDGDGPFLRTGDLGFFHEGELYVAGRIKDILIVRGRNLYPQDIELLVESVPGVRAGCIAAFAVADVDGSTEGLAIVAEVNEGTIGALDAAAQAVRAAVVDHFQVAPTEVVFIAPRTIPKTSSGKIQRHAARRLFEEGALEPVSGAGS